ncbi:MAG: glycosyltransferase family 39 protein [Candidatus Micrarchaeales archaeon]
MLRKENWKYWILLLILAYAFIYSVLFCMGVSSFGDDSAYSYLSYSVLNSNFRQTGYDLSVRVMQFYPIAFFYSIFGYGMLAASAWDILTFVGTIGLVFFIGKELYDDAAGLTASLLFAFSPIVVSFSSTLTDNMPVMFFSALAMLGVLYGERKGSKKWYFLSGISLVAGILVMPLGFVILAIVVLFLLAEILRHRIKIDKKLSYLAVGFAAALAISFIFNYINAGDPFITLETTFNFFTGTGANAIVAANTNLDFYITVMFPYHVLGTVWQNLLSGNFNPLSIYQRMPGYDISRVGFYFYAIFLSLLYLLVKREKGAYYAAFWFLIGFLLLEFDPLHVSLQPFVYMLQHRLDRYLSLIMPAGAILLGIACSSLIQIGVKRKNVVFFALPTVIILLLIATAVPSNIYWYQTVASQRYDTVAIANYLNVLPNNKRIYYANSAYNLVDYMGFNNVSRFSVYDWIKNCTSMQTNSYIILPRFINLYGLNYTPDPSSYCPWWRLILAPNDSAKYGQDITGSAYPFHVNLYYT